MQHDIDVAKRRFDDADAQRLFAEQRAAQLNPMRAMLDEANQTIARLRAREDELVEYVAMFETANRARMSAENELRHFIDEHQKEVQLILHTHNLKVSRLISCLKKERNTPYIQGRLQVD
jgi:hypothetical protein